MRCILLSPYLPSGVMYLRFPYRSYECFCFQNCFRFNGRWGHSVPTPQALQGRLLKANFPTANRATLRLQWAFPTRKVFSKQLPRGRCHPEMSPSWSGWLVGSSLQGLLVVVCVSPLSLAGGSCHVPVMQKKSLVTEEHLSSICLQWFLPAREDITDR